MGKFGGGLGGVLRGANEKGRVKGEMEKTVREKHQTRKTKN